jgi:hypothetical protein
MRIRAGRALSRAAALVVAVTIPSIALAQQPLSPVEIQADRAVRENARADTLEEIARSMYSNPRKFHEAAQLHRRAAMIRGDDPKAAESLRSAAWLYSAVKNNGLARQLMEKAAEKAAQSGNVELAANSYIDAALIALADNREDRVPVLLSRMHNVLRAPLLPQDKRAKILERIDANARIAQLDPGPHVAP